MNPNIPKSATVSAIRSLTGDTTLLTLRTEANNPVASSFYPGQFLQLSLPGVGEIPLSYCGYPSSDGIIELCIRHTGHVTTPLKASTVGDCVGVRGPFGKGFPLPLYQGHDILLIAGGLGMAPLRSLLLGLKQLEGIGRLTILYGARESGSLLFIDELLTLQKQGEIQLHLTVDRPGHCLLGPPDCRVALLPALLDTIEFDKDRTYAAICGPPAVYPHLVSGLQLMGLTEDRIHISLERRMKCGVGLCGHCAIGTRLCCVDGPVFCYAELAGIEGALA